MVLEVAPEWPASTVFQNYTVIFGFDDCSQEHDNVRMSDCFHGIALTEEIPQTNISIVNFKLFDHNYDFSPLGFEDDPVSSFIQSLNYIELRPLNL